MDEQDSQKPMDLEDIRDQLRDEFAAIAAIDGTRFVTETRLRRAMALSDLGSSIARVEGEIRERKLER